MPTRRVNSKHILLLVVLLAFGLRAQRLSFQPLWADEGYSIYFAAMPLADMASLTAVDIHPPLYYALLRGWRLAAGNGPVFNPGQRIDRVSQERKPPTSLTNDQVRQTRAFTRQEHPRFLAWLALGVVSGCRFAVQPVEGPAARIG